MKTALVTLVFLCPGLVLGVEGRVVHVHNGDTLTVLVDHRPVRIRLAEIDAPEVVQPFGRASTNSLKALCAAQDVEVTSMAKGPYGRTVGRVTCRQTDAGSHQVRNGMAWVYDQYSTPSSPLYLLQAQAIGAKRGLWAEQAPMAPWEWRAASPTRLKPATM